MAINLHILMVIIKFIFGVFWLLIVPGWIIIRLIAPRFSFFEKIVFSPPASISIIILFAYLVGWLKIKFDFGTVSIFIIFLILIHLSQNLNKYSNPFRSIRREFKEEKIFRPILLLPSLITLFILLIGFCGSIVPTQGMDIVNHTQFIFNIFYRHSVTEPCCR